MTYQSVIVCLEVKISSGKMTRAYLILFSVWCASGVSSENSAGRIDLNGVSKSTRQANQCLIDVYLP